VSDGKRYKTTIKQERSPSSLRISVLVPTFRRPTDFERCLEALKGQQRIPDEVVVVARATDEETQAVLARWRRKPFLRVAAVVESGQVQALNAGLDAVTGDIVMITDDDAAPHPDWCLRVAEHFAKDDRLGGVGGRDIVYAPEGLLEGYCTTTGKVQPWGRIVGNHHLIAPRKTEVAMLKGANMSYRMSSIGDLRFDTNLRGAGAQVNNDMAFSMAVAKRGWKLLYDPAVQVDHYPAPRHDNEKRGERNLLAVENVAFNTWWTLKRHLHPGLRRTMALLWEGLIGTAGHPGRLRGWIAQLRCDPTGIAIWAAARSGRNAAEQSYRKRTAMSGRS
jgi:cellulose synthase/poly-beta-1,6-N-acetylglucosamine synthase-like glycosyltransferase